MTEYLVALCVLAGVHSLVRQALASAARRRGRRLVPEKPMNRLLILEADMASAAVRLPAEPLDQD